MTDCASTTLAAAPPAQEDSTLACLLDVFAALSDPRSPHGRRYRLAPFLALVTIALLAGAKNPSQIYAFGQARPGLLGRLGFGPPQRVRKPERRNLPLAAPNEDTIGNLLALLSPAELNDKFTLFLARMVGRGANTAAMDGKALRGSGDFVLSVFVNELCQVVWQEDVGEKQNELSTLERSLPTLLERYPGLKLFTGDAAFCHKSIARALVKAKRDYFLQLKAPHQTDVALAEHSFNQLRTLAPAARSEEKGGPKGPEWVTHELWTDRQVGGYGHGSEGGGGGWPGLRQVVCVRTMREFLRGGQPAVVEDHYYLSSLRPTLRRGRPAALLGHARHHWEIENGLHHKKDRSMGEDAGRCRRGATALARLRSLAVGLLEHVAGTSTPLKQIALAANPLKALGLLKRLHFPKIRRMDN